MRLLEGVQRGVLVCSMLLCAGVLMSGCMQVETVLKLNPDGSAVITERVRFTKRLLDQGGKAGARFNVKRFLTREAAVKRMASMGTGVTLAKHEVLRTADGGRESVATFRTPDINKFRYVSPWLAYLDYPQNNVLQCRLEPVLKRWGPRVGAGQMVVVFEPLQKAKAPPHRNPNAAQPEGPSPLELQAYRDLAPLFRDALKDFHVRFTFESYAPILSSGLGLRGEPGIVKHVDLINFSWQDKDGIGDPFLDNEELMLDLVRWDLGSDDIQKHVRGFPNNVTLPVFVPYLRVPTHTAFKPSRLFFDKYFKGKTLDLSRYGYPPDKHVAAFETIGWKGGQ
jgi:hypothetical protein